MKRSIIFSLIFIWNLLIIPAVYSWQLPLEVTVSGGNGEIIRSRLVAGVEKEATDGYDNLWDTPALITSPDPDSPVTLSAYFSRDINDDLRPDLVSGNRYLWKDIRGTAKAGDTVWHITLDSIPKGKNVTVKWDVPQGNLKANERLVLKDNGTAGTDSQPAVTDIMQASSYEFVSEGYGSRSMSLVLTTGRANDSNGGSWNGLGCGTIKTGRSNTSSWKNDSLVNLFLLFSPLFFWRFRRRWSASRR